MFKLRMYVLCITNTQLGHGWNCIRVRQIGIELVIDPSPQWEFCSYAFLILRYISHKMKYVSPLRETTLTCKQYKRYRSFRSPELFSSFYCQMFVEAKDP